MNIFAAYDALGGVDVLGEEVRSETDFVDAVEAGLPTSTVGHLQRLGDLSDAEMSAIIPRRTLSHLKGTTRLTTDQSDRVARTAALFAQAHQVFGNRDKANRWLRKPNRALHGRAPLALLRTSSGATLVEQVLGRIAYGVYS